MYKHTHNGPTFSFYLGCIPTDSVEANVREMFIRMEKNIKKKKRNDKKRSSIQMNAKPVEVSKICRVTCLCFLFVSHFSDYYAKKRSFSRDTFIDSVVLISCSPVNVSIYAPI